MTKIIAIDLDETLTETIDSVLKFNNYLIKNIPITKSEVTCYQLRNIPKYKRLGIEQSDGMKLFNDYIESPENIYCEKVAGAKEKIQEWKNKGYGLYILTARAEDQTDLTKARLNKNIPGIFDDQSIIFANHFTDKARSKGDICQEIGASIMIEDNLDYAKELSSKGITTYLLKKPRNKDYDNSDPKIILVDGRNDINL